MARPRHTNKHIETAIRMAERLGWRVQKSEGHAWGFLFCPRRGRDGCRVTVLSTPTNPESHAKRLEREIRACPHQSGGEGDG